MLLFRCLQMRAFVVLAGLLLWGKPAKANWLNQWTSLALNAGRESTQSAAEISRSMAMLHTAVYNSIEGIQGDHYLYSHGAYTGPGVTPELGASTEAAAVTAAYTVLSNLYSDTSGSFANLYATQMNTLTDGTSTLNGINYGSLVADGILSWRTLDGASDANNPAHYTPITSTGHWSPVGAAGNAMVPGWGSVDTFSISNPATYTGTLGMTNAAYVASTQYTTDYNEVKSIGSTTSPRTQEQTDAAHFWNGQPGTTTNVGLWNQVAMTIIDNEGLDMQQAARLYAALNVALADTAITTWATKIETDLWSPEAAILSGNVDGNPDTMGDPTWQPLLPSISAPTYFAEQASLGAAATGILETFVGTNYAFTLTSDTDGDGDIDLTMQFDSLSDALIQAMNSGIWGGIYMRSAAEDALDSGDQIATLVMGTQFVAVPEPGGLLLLAVSSLTLMFRRRR